MAKHWIQSAIHKKGALRSAASHAGMSTMAYARKHEHDSGKTGRRARLALTLSHLRRHRKMGGIGHAAS